MLVLHIIIAMASLVWATIAYVRPSGNKLRISYAFTGATLATGTLLVVMDHSVLVQACTSGLAYLAISLSATALTHRKLAVQTD